MVSRPEHCDSGNFPRSAGSGLPGTNPVPLAGRLLRPAQGLALPWLAPVGRGVTGRPDCGSAAGVVGRDRPKAKRRGSWGPPASGPAPARTFSRSRSRSAARCASRIDHIPTPTPAAVGCRIRVCHVERERDQQSQAGALWNRDPHWSLGQPPLLSAPHPCPAPHARMSPRPREMGPPPAPWFQHLGQRRGARARPLALSSSHVGMGSDKGSGGGASWVLGFPSFTRSFVHSVQSLWSHP